MPRTTFFTVVCLISLFSQICSAESQSDLSLAEFRRLHDALQPPAEAAWRDLPWHTSIVTAVQAAARDNKPLYMLVRSGHPLGCV